MGKLLRNSNRIITPADGKPFKENNPEEYITRFHHFAAGLGFKPEHLTGGDNPAFTGKEIETEWINNDPRSQLRGIVETSTAYGFDEGLIPSGYLHAATEALPRINPGVYDDVDVEYGLNELRHRDLMGIGMTEYHGKHEGEGVGYDLTVAKGLNSPHKTQSPVRGYPHLLTSGTGTKHSFDAVTANVPDLINDVATRFRERNRSRLVNPRGLELARQAIANPSTRRVTEAHRTRPSTVSPQFLGVTSSVRTGGYPTDGSRPNIDKMADAIDLKTGTWAKIDPDGYFPD